MRLNTHPQPAVRPKRPHKAGLVAIAALIALTATACSAPGPGEPETQVLTIAVSAVPGSFEPSGLGVSGPNAQAWQPVYDTLLRADAEGNISPNAAESFEFNDDNTVLTLKIRPGMTFTDGSPVDAAAAKASIEAARDSSGGASFQLFGVVVDAPSDDTVTVTSPQPNPGLATALTTSGGALISLTALASDDLPTNPVGSGPYTLDLERTTTDSTYTYVRNDDYWNSDAFPYDEIVQKVLPDETARLSALRTGQVDGAELSSQNAGAAESGGATVLKAPSTWVGIVLGDRNGVKIPALADVRVRQAINMVFDREAIVENTYGGDAIPTTQIFNPNSAAYDESLDSAYEFDVDAAKQLMADAGYADGFELAMPDFPNPSQVLNPLIVQQLALLNITVTFESVQFQQMIVDVPAGKWGAIVGSFALSNSLSDINGVLAPSGYVNFFHTEDPELTQLLAEAAVAPVDDTTEAYRNLNEWAVENAWVVPLAAINAYYGIGDSVSADLVTGDVVPPIWAFSPAE